MMKFAVSIENPRQFPNILAALQIIDSTAEINEDSPNYRLVITRLAIDSLQIILIDTRDQQHKWEYRDPFFMDHRFSDSGREQRFKEMIRLGIIALLQDELGRTAPWGILSAVRPTKIVHYLRDRGFTIDEIRNQLHSFYLIEPAKVAMLIEVSLKQERFFKPSHVVGIYLGIPFCPTRCHYCSFPAVPLTTHRHFVSDFLHKLTIEIEDTAKLCQTLGLEIESVYVGGGTPTSLSDSDFAAMVQNVSKHFYTQNTREFTVEAGRPETLTQTKIAAMISAGVTRISINPQSMHQTTLDRIGREHTVSQVYSAVAMVRKTGLILNMDLIAGLPGEGRIELLDSLKRVMEFEPENITMHTLAPKRAATWRRDFKSLSSAAETELAAAIEAGRKILQQAGYQPYYLYRQRSILAGQENIGYAKPGFESIYNIQMMEERQTILGLGAGSVTKWVFGSGHQVVRHQNPKCPATYCQRIDEELVKKAQQTRLLLD